ncbi:MAG: hypothetical protein GY948_05615 [Alphaproteobacteria bacterium]|nr:hypothetical protein [Alphaproteobacteria bacterium]
MDEKLVKRIMEHFERGDKVLFGFDHFGAVRVKVKHGPFNLLTTHLQTDQETFNTIQACLSEDGDEDEQSSETACERDPLFAPVRSEPELAVDPPSQKPVEAIWEETRPAAGSNHDRNGAVANDHITKAPCLDVRGQLPRRDFYGTAQWNSSSKSYRCQHDQQRFEPQLDNQEIEAHRFALIDIDGAWRDMMAGEIPEIASEVWRRMHPRKPVHEIANEMQIPLRDCLFWLCVFKRHLEVWAATDGGTYTFHRGVDQPVLSVAVRMKREPVR